MDDKKFNPQKLHKLNDPQRLIDIPPAFICSKLTTKKPGVLVEIGAGTAFFSVAFHQQLKPATTYACDVSETMIEWIKENIFPCHPYIIPVKTEESVVPLADDIADLVFMINLHHELQDQSAIVAECYRLLKPGGEVFIVDWKKQEMPQGPPVNIRCVPEAVEEQLALSGFSAINSFDELVKHFLVVGKK